MMGIDPFEIAVHDSDTPPDSPFETRTMDDELLKESNVKNASPTNTPANSDDEENEGNEGVSRPNNHQQPQDVDAAHPKAGKEDEEENVDVALTKYTTDNDKDKIQKITAIMSQLTSEQMNRYESFRRSGFQKSNMRRVLQSIAGCPISLPTTIVMSGVAKMFVGELVETSRIIMKERNETGPIHPCHVREAYRRLKLEGKVPRRSKPRLFK